jgi:S1-C subfamily serine protease
VKVKELSQGKLMASGVQKGFIISKADGKPVQSVEELGSIIASATGGILIEGYYPNGTKAYYGLGL